MSVPNALKIIDCMTEIALADHSDLDPSRHAQARAVWSLHWVVSYARKYYFHNTVELAPCVAYAAAPAGHLVALQYASAPFDEQSYCDMAEELGEVYYDVRRQHINLSGLEYFICLRGTDPLESEFGLVRTAHGQGGVLDIVQLRRRLAIATQIEEIFAHAPGYKPKRRRSSQADNMMPADAGPCSLPINLPELWQEGVCYAQRDMGIHFSDLQIADVALLAPRGTGLKFVINPDAEEEAVADLAEVEEEEDWDDEVQNCVDEAQEFFGPQQPLLDFEGGPKSKQHILNVLVNDALHASPRDPLQRALQQAQPGLPAEPTLNLNGEDGPIVGDTFATSFLREKKAKPSPVLFTCSHLPWEEDARRAHC